jgi:hypothetical protein
MLESLLSAVLEAVALIVAPILAGYAVLLIKRVADKAGITLSAEKEAAVEIQVRNLLLQVEEYAAAKLKATGVVVSSEDKLQRFVIAAVDKIPGITTAEATALARAELPKLGLGAAATFRAVTVAATNSDK